MADAFRQFELLLRENISPAVLMLDREDDDALWNLMGTFPAETLGGKTDWDVSGGSYPAGYEAKYRIKTQRAGRVTGGKFTGNTLVQMGKDAHLSTGQAADQKYPDPTLTPLASYITIKMLLKRIKMSTTLNHEQIVARMATEPIEDVTADVIDDLVARHRSYLTNYAHTDGSASLAQVNGAATSVETAGGVEVAIDAGTWGRFMEGDIIVAGTNADPYVLITGDGANGHTGRMRVVNVDHRDRTIWLQSEPGVGSVVLADNSHLILEGTYDFSAASVATGSLVPQGLEAYLIDTGTYPNSTSPLFQSGLNVEHHSYLRGFVSSSSPMVDPTMEEVTDLLDTILELELSPPTAFISERSVWTRFSQLEKQNNAVVQVPMGATFQAAGGVSGPTLSHQEFTFQKFNSKRIAPNAIHAINPSVWRRFMPMGDRSINWVMGRGVLSGYPSIFRPVTDGTQLTELSAAEGNGYVEFGCVDPRANFRRTGLKSQRDV